MTSKVSIANQAISWLGGNKIVAFTDDSDEAELVSANYDELRKAVLEEAEWSFAVKRDILNPIRDVPIFGASKAFLKPPDHLRTFSVRSDQDLFGPSNLYWYQEGDKILCDSETIYIRYCEDLNDVNLFSPGFIQALAQRIAADISLPLTQSRSMQENMWSLYRQKLTDAITIDNMQGRSQATNSSRLTSVRGRSVGTQVAPIYV